MKGRWKFLDLNLLKVRGYLFIFNLTDFVRKDVVSNMDELYYLKGFFLCFF